MREIGFRSYILTREFELGLCQFPSSPTMLLLPSYPQISVIHRSEKSSANGIHQN